MGCCGRMLSCCGIICTISRYHILEAADTVRLTISTSAVPLAVPHRWALGPTGVIGMCDVRLGRFLGAFRGTYCGDGGHDEGVSFWHLTPVTKSLAWAARSRACSRRGSVIVRRHCASGRSSRREIEKDAGRRLSNSRHLSVIEPCFSIFRAPALSGRA